MKVHDGYPNGLLGGSVPNLAFWESGRRALCLPMPIRVAHKFPSSPTTATLSSRLNVHFLYLQGWLLTRVTL
jgi:hypothetical protein